MQSKSLPPLSPDVSPAVTLFTSVKRDGVGPFLAPQTWLSTKLFSLA